MEGRGGEGVEGEGWEWEIFLADDSKVVDFPRVWFLTTIQYFAAFNKQEVFGCSTLVVVTY